LRELVEFCAAVRAGRRRLEIEDLEFIRVLLINLAATKAGPGDLQRLDLINSIQKVDELFEQLRALLLGEARRLLEGALGRRVQAEEMDGLLKALEESGGEEGATVAGQVWQALGQEIERAVVRASLSLDLSADYPHMVQGLAERSEHLIEEFLQEATLQEDPLAAEHQGVIVNLQRALAAARAAGGEELVEAVDQQDQDAEVLADLVQRVEAILGLVPEKPHNATSGSRTALRRALKEFAAIRQRHPADPDQLGPLAMALVRLDQADNYEKLLEQVRWMGKYALGRRLKKGARAWYTPGLLKVIDEDGPGSGPIAGKAAALVEELADEETRKALALIK
jgi:hypothetical protein